MAALNFPGNAVYRSYAFRKDNITPFELIPWILAECKNIDEALFLLSKLNLLCENFSKQLPLSPLHWIVADSSQSVTVEPLSNGLQIHENPFGVLTNNPPFDFHMRNLENYLNVTSSEATNRFSKLLNLTPTSRGMGGIGLPGDLSSTSRFVRATFTKFNSQCGTSEQESISQYFHILASVAQQNGCVQVGKAYEKTVYSSCCNTDKGIYYYTTYENSQITAVSLFNENLNANKLIAYPLITDQQIRFIN